MSLRGKIVRGAFWSLVERGGQQGISFIVFMVVARLVGPVEYGLANVCFIVFTIVNLIILGIVDGIVNLQIDDDDRLSTLFWVLMGIGLAFAGACAVGAGPLADALHQPRLADLLREFAAVPVLLATSAVPNMILLKNLDFRIFALRSLAASGIGGTVGIFLAFRGIGAHALVVQQIVLFLTVNLVVWPYARWRPRLRFCSAKVFATIFPGLKMTASMLVSVLEQEVPRILIVFSMSPLMLGYYSFVVRVRYAIQDICVNPPLAVLYPALAQINDRRDEQRAILGLFILAVGFIIFPTLGSAAVTAPLYMPLVFGHKWDEAIPLLQVFIACGTVTPFQFIVREILRAHNRLEAYLRLQIAYVALLLLVIFLLLPHGLMVLGYGTLGVGLFFLPIFFFLLQKWEGIGLWGEMAKLWAPLAGTILLVLATLAAAHSAWAPANPWLRLLAALSVGWVVYLLTCLLLMRREMQQLWAFLRRWRAGRARMDQPQ